MRNLALVISLSLVAIAADAQESGRPSPEQMRQLMESGMSSMVPLMAKMAEVSIEAQLSAAEKPETAARLARFKKNLYDALIKQGFSEERAFTIMLNTQAPSAVGGLR